MNMLKTLTAAGMSLSLFAGPSLLRAGQAAAPPAGFDALPQWSGEWETESEIYAEPGKPPLKAKGKEKAQMVGRHWLVCEGESDMMGTPYKVVTIIGFDEKKKMFAATTVDAFSNVQFRHEGPIDAAGKIITMEGTLPDPANPSQRAKLRQVLEIKTPDHKVYSSFLQSANGKWDLVFKTDCRRKK